VVVAVRQISIPKHILDRQSLRLRRRSLPPRLRLRFLLPLGIVAAVPFALLRGPESGEPPQLPTAAAATHRPDPAPPATVAPAAVPKAAPTPAPVASPRIPGARVLGGALREGSSLLGALQSAGLGREALFELLDAAGKVIDFRRCRTGDRYRLVISPSGEPERLEYYGATSDEVRGATRKNGRLVPLRQPLQGQRDVRVYRGKVTSSLEAAVVEAGGSPTLAANLADLFAWDLDFNVDARSGDAFTIAVERVRLPDGTWREGAIAGAQYRGALGRFRAFRFRDGYYDERGRPLRRRYLASPLPFVRITSRFGRRWHPILARVTHHGGIDYAAPTGTPVRAVADGRVAFAGRRGGYGKLVVLRHADGMKTYYAHLSRIASGVRRGARIEQKAVIGRVGTTGRSTGPHLHFAMRSGGRFVDPAKVRGRRAAPLPARLAPEFRRVMARVSASLSGDLVASAR
jgi:murein DD-endopeptidase MepM/ murein hydrolase activator NlpD